MAAYRDVSECLYVQLLGWSVNVCLVSLRVFLCTPGIVCVSFHMVVFVKVCYSASNSIVEYKCLCQHASRLRLCMCASSSSLCTYVSWYQEDATRFSLFMLL